MSRGGPEPALPVLSEVEGSEANGCPPWHVTAKQRMTRVTLRVEPKAES
ncbi:MAG: hypothetical protein OXF97_06910 [Nitrospira sp.]|nr:hypothetical protein [Nitrospira sp.]MCY3955407.1 hypothetical protein [Nitrospira sp.]